MPKGSVDVADASDTIFSPIVLEDSDMDLNRVYSVFDMSATIFANIKWVSLDVNHPDLFENHDPFAFLKTESKS